MFNHPLAEGSVGGWDIDEARGDGNGSDLENA
jgi:hypothetical protein